MIGNYIRTADWQNEKHVPVIDATPAGDGAFEVTVTIGKQIPHPNTSEHYIAWAALYYVGEGSPNAIELARCNFCAHADGAQSGAAAALTRPTFTTRVVLPKSGKLLATAYCNLHGLWSSEIDVAV
ncbi:MAG: class II SORL domain-containing protein [Kiritimatiellia bacterium]